MERFQKIKKSNWRRLNTEAICRLCGLEHEEKSNILQINEDGVEFRTKIELMLGIKISASDKLPKNVCFICIDKVFNTFPQYV
jgi:Zinc-finger associated domain (zf-AD)